MNIFSHADRAVVAREAGRCLTEKLAHTKNPILLLFSGGSALDIVHSLDVCAIDHRVTIGLVDERYTNDPLQTNFLHLLRHPFFIPALRNGASLIDPTTGYKETIKDKANRIDKSYKKWMVEHKNGSVICTAGIGEDGHTAGIFPMDGNENEFTQRFVKTERFVIEYRFPNPVETAQRVTSTIALLRSASCILLYAVGRKKRPALEKLCAAEGRLEETPARIYREFAQDAVCLFTDQLDLQYALE
jgi:6-phosphogluconolactonase/glucosamine-6-phosphate isomerase/deaminase